MKGPKAGHYGMPFWQEERCLLPKGFQLQMFSPLFSSFYTSDAPYPYMKSCQHHWVGKAIMQLLLTPARTSCLNWPWSETGRKKGFILHWVKIQNKMDPDRKHHPLNTCLMYRVKVISYPSSTTYSWTLQGPSYNVGFQFMFDVQEWYFYCNYEWNFTCLNQSN